MRATSRGSRNYTPAVAGISAIIVVVVAVLYFLPSRLRPEIGGFDLTVLPLLNAVFNSLTTVFLLAGYAAIRRKRRDTHRRFILAAFATTALFLLTYIVYHSLAPSTPYGGEGVLRTVYYFILITHVVLAAIIVPVALFALFTGLNLEVVRHRRIARWAMPLWLYVSITGVLVYVLISPYY
ncbi:MAG: DUF420 domain-containing protein [Firmicutes bacterium]|nr:DUF420 domain-containing protein [Bacillota bacterium]